MKALVMAFCASLLIWGSAATARAAEIASFPSVGIWKVTAYSNDPTGRFAYCDSVAPYRNGVDLIVATTRLFYWELGFFNASWNLQPHHATPVTLSFDGGHPFPLAGQEGDHFVLVLIPNSQDLLPELRDAQTMSVRIFGRSIPFDLTDTSALIPALRRCVRTELATEPLPLRHAPTVAAERPRAVVPGATEAGSGTSLELVATRIASNLLLAAKLPDARLLPPSQTPAALQGRGVAWISGVGSGAVELLPATAGQGPENVGSELISSDADTCAGDFESGRSSALVGDKVVTKVFTACKGQDRAIGTRYFIIPGPSGMFVVFALFNNASTQAPPASSALSGPRFEDAAVDAAYSRKGNVPPGATLPIDRITSPRSAQ